MSTTFRSTCMAILLFACISWDGCFGKIFLCVDRGGLSHNGTSVIAEIGQPASVSFCVDTDHHVHRSLKIGHPSAISYWYLNSTKGRITTRFVNDGTKATITITINPVEENDFLDGLHVTVYAEPVYNGGSLLLFFQLCRKTGSPIKMNPITFTNRRIGNTWIQSGNDVAVNCSMTGCPKPDVLSLANDANLTLSAYRKSFVVHEITRVQCSDMGTYYCRAESEGLEDRRDLLVEQCPLQLCRGQEKSVTIPMKLNQTTSVSVCLMSDEMPTWENAHGSKDISVVFTQRNGSRIYFSAEISVSKTGDGHSDGFTIVMRNRHGSLDYLVKIQPVEHLGPPGDSPEQSPSSEQTNLLPFVLPLVLALFMVFLVIILFVVHRQKVKRYNETISVLLNTMNSKENTNSEIEQGRYENIQGVEASVKLMPAVSEEEDETKTYCVIQEY